MEYVPYVPCSKMNPCDLGSISKSLQAAMVKLQALRKGYEGDVHTRSATSTHGIPREPKPPDSCQGEHHLLHKCSKSSPTLRGKGITPLLPTFNGKNSRAFVSWLYDVECYFESKCFSKERKLELVVSCLKGSALLWYNTLNLSRIVEGKGKLSSWLKLERNMRLKFLPCSTMDDLWAELKTLKQNSLSVVEYAKLFEELHFVCAKEVDAVQKGVRFYHGLKSEIARKINLGMMHSYGEMLELALYIEESLARPKNKEVLAKGDRIKDIKTVGKEKEHVAELVACPSIYLSPLELSINKKLQQPLSLKMDNFLGSFEGEMCWDSSKGKARGGPWVVPYLRVPNLTSYTSHDPCFKSNILEGITCTLSTPHFHFYMLIRLQVSLVHLGAISYMLVKESKHMNANMSKLFWNNELSHFENFRGLKYVSWVLLMLLRRISALEMIILIFSRWKLFVNNRIDSFSTYCPILKSLCFGLSIVQVHGESLLGLFGTSSVRSLHGVEGVVVHLVLFMISPIHKNSSSPLSAILCSTSRVESHYGLSLGEYTLLVLVCQMNKEQPQTSLRPDLSKNFSGKRVFNPGGTLHPTNLKDDDNCLSEHYSSNGLQFQLGIETLGDYGHALKSFDSRMYAWGFKSLLWRGWI